MAIGSAEIPISKAVVSNLVNQRWNPKVQRDQLALIQSMNERHLEDAVADQRIEVGTDGLPIHAIRLSENLVAPITANVRIIRDGRTLLGRGRPDLAA